MTDDRVKRTVEGAFRPLRCVAEIWDYGQKLKFRVFGLDGSVIYSVAECPINLTEKMRSFLEEHRNEKISVVLDPLELA